MLVSVIGCINSLPGKNSHKQTEKQTDTQTTYHNPRCACAPSIFHGIARIRGTYLLAYVHIPISQGLIDGPGEEDIKEKALYNYEAYDPPSKPEPVKVILYEHGCGADLDCVRVVGRVLKEAIVWIEDLTRQEEEEFSRWTTIVQTVNRQFNHY